MQCADPRVHCRGNCTIRFFNIDQRELTDRDVAPLTGLAFIGSPRIRRKKPRAGARWRPPNCKLIHFIG